MAHTVLRVPNATLAEIFPGLSVVGRRRSDQPPCCDDPQTPPALSPALNALLLDLFQI